MGGFGGFPWGGGGGTAATAGVPLSDLILPAYRIAGITLLAGVTPNPEKFAEAIGMVNRQLSSWNCDGHKIFTTSIATYPLVSGQKIYTIGPGGDFDTARPVYIALANILFPTDPVVRWPLRIVDDEEWSSIAVQDIPGAPPYVLYYDGGMNSSGQGQIYLYFQPPAGYTLELYTWQSLQGSFTSITDVAIFPPGYEHAIVYGLAKNLAAMNPHIANMLPASYDEADRALRTLISLNSRAPGISCEPGLDGGDPGPGYGWLDGSIR